MNVITLDRTRDEAARWHALTMLGNLTADDERKLDDWLARDLAHRLAYADVAATGFALEQAAPRVEILAAKAPVWTRLLAIAATIVVAVGIALLGPHAWQDLRSDARTAAGVLTTRALADGSTLKLDTDSAVALDFSGTKREVELMRGALAVEVVKDPTRPFRVHAGGVEATAVGTKYVVERKVGGGVEVGVTEGRVAVRATPGAEPVMVTAGERVRIDASGRTTGPEPFSPLAYGWTRGVLSFDRVPLREAVREIERYLPGRVWVRADADTPVTATFPADEPAAALESLARANGLEAKRVAGLWIVQAR